MNYAIINAKILDGTKDMRIKEGYTILVSNHKIEKIVEGTIQLMNYETINLEGKYVMPGLINLHVHLPSTGKPSKKEINHQQLVSFVQKHAMTRAYLQAMCEKNCRMQLLSGVTTIRTMGGVDTYDSLIRDKIERGEIVGPRLLVSNMAISVPEGHMAGSLAYEAHNVEEVKTFVRQLASENVDWIKLMITGGVLDAKKRGEPGVLKMPGEYVKAACDLAHELHLKVASHTESSEGVKVALENGVDTIEHGALFNHEHIALFKKNMASLVATISPALPFALFDPQITHINEMTQYNGQLVFEGIIEGAKTCLKNNIPVGLGTDTGCPYITHYDMWREVYYFKKYCSVTNQFALYIATLQNAKIAGIDTYTGSIEGGKDADLLVLNDNPLEDLKALSQPYMVMSRGRLIKNPKVKK